MANIRRIRRRIQSARNIAQITKAMELVAASKMRKAQNAAISGKLYAEKIYEMVLRLSAKVEISSHPLLTRPKTLTGKRVIIFISTNKGLCGGLNSNLFRFHDRTYADVRKLSYITCGSKGATHVVRLQGELLADFSPVVPFTGNVPAVTELARTRYLTGTFDGVDIVFNEFVSVLRQTPRRKTILPLTLEHVNTEQGNTDKNSSKDILIEPNIPEVFDALLPHYLENQIRDAILQAQASEHSARMIAMRNATDNAIALTDELTLMYNKARQEKITYEISDMVTARLAVEPQV